MGSNLKYGKDVIVHNKIKCNHCGDIIESNNVHDFKWCKCMTVFVDGGHEYLRRGFKSSTDDYEELSEVIKINSHGVNTNITYSLLSEDKMKELGFKLVPDDNPTIWFRRFLLKKPRKIDKKIYISLNVSLPIDYNPDDLDIAVIDEDYLQPYDYQYFISSAENKEDINRIALAVNEEVEEIIAGLQKAGVLSGHNKGDYI